MSVEKLIKEIESRRCVFKPSLKDYLLFTYEYSCRLLESRGLDTVKYINCAMQVELMNLKDCVDGYYKNTNELYTAYAPTVSAVDSLLDDKHMKNINDSAVRQILRRYETQKELEDSL